MRKDVKNHIDAEYIGEVKSWSDCLGLDWEWVMLANMLYEGETAAVKSLGCTSIVAQQKNGLILHGRNLGETILNSTFLAHSRKKKTEKIFEELEILFARSWIMASQNFVPAQFK